MAAGGEPAHRLGGWRTLVDQLVGVGGSCCRNSSSASGVTAPTRAPSLRESVSPSLWLVTSSWGGVVSDAADPGVRVACGADVGQPLQEEGVRIAPRPDGGGLGRRGGWGRRERVGRGPPGALQRRLDGLAGARRAGGVTAQPGRGQVDDLGPPRRGEHGQPVAEQLRARPAGARAVQEQVEPVAEQGVERGGIAQRRRVVGPGGPRQRVVPHHPDPQPPRLLERSEPLGEPGRLRLPDPPVVVPVAVGHGHRRVEARHRDPQLRHGEERPRLRVVEDGPLEAVVEVGEQLGPQLQLGEVRFDRRPFAGLTRVEVGLARRTGHVPRARHDDHPTRVDAERDPQPGRGTPAPRPAVAAVPTR